MPELVNVSKSYKVANGRVEALKNVSLSFDSAEFVSVLGPSGCGKTTLLNVIGGLDRYDSGDLIINGVSTRKFKERDWDTYRNHSVGFVFQSYNLIPHQTVFSNVELALTLAGISKKERRRLVNEALAKVGLSDQASKKPNQMSGGQMQRVAIARALVNGPEILLADEPTGALDSVTSVQIMEILKDISKDRLIIMVTHNPELALRYSTRIVRLKDGQVVSDTKVSNGSETVDGGVPAIGETFSPEGAGSAASDGEAEKDAALSDICEAGPGNEEKELSGGRPFEFSDRLLSASRRLSGIRSSLSGNETEVLYSDDVCGPSGAGEAPAGSEPQDDNTAEDVSLDRGPALQVPADNISGETAAASADVVTAPVSAKRNKGRKKKTSMSFFTALSLSFNNLLTKKGRTFMTAFAGSIGIIGIALILAMSTGIKKFIDDVQKDTLSSYPINIVSEHLDLTAVLSSMSGSKERTEREPGKVYSDESAYDTFNAIFSQDRRKNNLTAFKKWLDESLSDGSGEDLSELVSAVHYGYDVKFKTYVSDGGSRYRSTDYTDIFSFSRSDQDAGSSGMLGSLGGLNSYSLWEEIVPGPDGEPVSGMIKDQYDLLYGRWPEKATDILLKVDINNEISDLAFYTLGMMSSEELTGVIGAVMSRNEIKVEEKSLLYEEILNIRLKLVIPTELYRDNDGDGVFEYIGNSEDMLSLIVKNCPELNICGIIKKNPDVTATAMNSYTVFAYTNLLTEMIIGKTAETDAARAFIASEDENFDIFTGLPFVPDLRSLSDEEKAEEVVQKAAGYTVEQKAEKYEKIILTPDSEYIDKAIRDIADISDRDEAEKLIAEAYGMDVSIIKDYLDSYSDDELFEMLSQAAARYVTEQYEKEARIKIEDVLSTPSAEELELLSALISSRFPDRQSKTGFTASYWESVGVMSAEKAFSYLAGLDEETFDGIFLKAVNGTALNTYREASQNDPEASARKLSAAFDDLISSADAAEKARYYDILVSDEISPMSYAEYRTMLGIADIDSPSFVNIYPTTFENKDRIASRIKGYNETVSEEDKISYTDFVEILMSGVTIIINVISYVLIAFVAVSLVVSSIMIGIITYISVLERTKEIGILRSIGASRRDVSRVFTAETLIIGLISGLIGIGFSAILCIPINIIIHWLSGIGNINAVLPWTACVVLVIISMALTLIAGLFPSRSAAHKDPVEALRTE